MKQGARKLILNERLQDARAKEWLRCTGAGRRMSGYKENSRARSKGLRRAHIFDNIDCVVDAIELC